MNHLVENDCQKNTFVGRGCDQLIHVSTIQISKIERHVVGVQCSNAARTLADSSARLKITDNGRYTHRSRSNHFVVVSPTELEVVWPVAFATATIVAKTNAVFPGVAKTAEHE